MGFRNQRYAGGFPKPRTCRRISETLLWYDWAIHMKIAFFETDKEEEAYFSRELAGKGFELVFAEEALNKEFQKPGHGFGNPTDAEIISVFVGSVIDVSVLRKFPNLKLIATRSTGYDHIDLAACKGRSIAVANVPTYGEYTVAEYAFGLMLMLSRRLYEAYHEVREAGNFSVKGLRGFDLYGKTLGVIGTGNIGRHVVKIGKGFSMQVVAVDAKPDELFARETGFTYRSLQDVLRMSDIVTLHVPYLPSTHHLLNRENMGLMKRGAYLINTSRGAVVETEALLDALKSGQIAGAGLDVLEEEGITKDEFGYLLAQGELNKRFRKSSGFPKSSFRASSGAAGPDLRVVLANHVLIDLPNVIVTPHNAFNTDGAWGRILGTTLRNIVNFAEGAPYAAVT